MPFALFCRSWKTTTSDDGFDSHCILDAQGKGSMENLAPAWVVRATTRAQRVPYAPHSATDSIRKGFCPQRICLPVKTPNETRKKEEWGLVRRIANPCLSPRAVSYLTMFPRCLSRSGSIERHLCCRTRSSVFAATRGSVHGWLPSWLPFLCDERRSPDTRWS